MKTISGVNERALGVGARVGIIRGGRVLGVEVPATNVLLEWTKEREVPARLSFSAPRSWVPKTPYDPLANFGQRAVLTGLVESEGRTVEVPFGQFLITMWEEKDDAVEVEAYDLMQILAENPMPFPSSPPPSATLFSELVRLADGLPVILDCEDVPVDRGIQFGYDRVEAVKNLCEASGVSYAVKADGCLHAFTSDVNAPVVLYSQGELVVEAFRQAPQRRANRVLVVGDEEKSVHAFAENDAPPYNFDEYGRVTLRVENEAATTREAAQSIANAKAVAVARTVRKRSFTVLADPRLEGGDTVAVVTPGETVTGKVCALALNLSDPSELMRVDVEVEEW